MTPEHVVSILLEDGDMSDMIQRLTKDAIAAATPKQLPVGEVFMRATSRSEDVVEMELGLLMKYNRPAYNTVRSTYTDELEAYQHLLDGSEDVSEYEIVDDFAYNTLDSIIQDMCPPYTSFGGHESDGDWGVWPSSEGLEDADDVAHVEVEYHEWDSVGEGRVRDAAGGNDYVWFDDPVSGKSQLWNARNVQLIWSY